MDIQKNIINGETAADEALVKRARAGDFEGFEALVNRYEGRVYSIALNILRRQHDAEDVVQTVFMNALEHIRDFREEASFKTWLTRIAVNQSLKALRKRKGLSEVSLRQEQEETGSVHKPHYIAEWHGDPAAITERRELAQILDEAIDSLDDKHRAVFVLRDIEGLSTRETAQTLEIGEANVKVRLLRARLALREHLTRTFGDPNKQYTSGSDHGGESASAETLLQIYRSGAS